MAKILITGAVQLSEYLKHEIISLGYEVIFVQNELEPLRFEPFDIEVVICNGLFIHNDISMFSSLKYIQVTSAGLDRLPIDQITRRGIIVKNARCVYSIPMAEWAVAAILSLYKNIPFHISNQMQQRWFKDREARELSGSSALIVGMGSVGEEVAKRLCGMDVLVSGVDMVDVRSQYIDKCFNINDLHRVICRYDIIVLTLPLTTNTHHIINVDILDNLPKESILINISRGAIIDEGDLIDALTIGKIRGAALDVFEHEPLTIDSPLWRMGNVIITPHNSFVSPKNKSRLERVIIENLRSYHDQQ